MEERWIRLITQILWQLIQVLCGGKNMGQEPLQRRRRRLWPAVVVLLVLVLIGLALPIFEGKRHQRIAEELEARGANVLFSHFEPVPVSGPSGTVFVSRSALPKFMDQTGLSLAVRRIRKVSVMEPSEITAVLPLIRQIGELDQLRLFNSSMTASQLESLLSDVRVESLDIRASILPQTGMPWLNREDLKFLVVERTNFSNPAIDDLPDSLIILNATRTRINDDGLNLFLRLKHLRVLVLSGTPCTDAGIEDLRKKMPWCKIEWEGSVIIAD